MNITDKIAAGKVEAITDSNGVATITFFHPSHNSLPGVLLNEMANTIIRVGHEKTTKVIVLTSEGDRTFCAGASFDEMLCIENEDQGITFFSGFAKVINACRKSPKIIIGRVQGKAIGGGVGIAAATDYCFATTHAAVKLSELEVGIGPFVVGPAVERKIGLAGFAELSLDASKFRSAEWARDKGLYASVHESIEEMDEAVNAFATRFAVTYNPEALHALKEVLWQGTSHWDEMLIHRAMISSSLALTDFTRNNLIKFKSK